VVGVLFWPDGGMAACVNLLWLELAGVKGARIYPDS